MRVVVFGRGKVGRGLASALRQTRHDVKLVKGTSSPKLQDADLVILAVPDAAVGEVAERVSPNLSQHSALVHCAGSFGAEVFNDLEGRFARGAMHPLVSLPTRRAPDLSNATFVISGDRRAVQLAAELARDLGCRPLKKPLHGPAYHAAAAMVANGSAALAFVGVELIEHLGASRRQAQQAVGALLRSVAENVENVGVPDALSGPIRRGNVETLMAHREALRSHPPLFLQSYDQVAPLIVGCARAIGELPASRLRALVRALRKD